MRLDRLRNFALSLQQVAVVKQWGDALVFKVAGKVFLVVALDGEVIDGVVFKCSRDEFAELTETDGIIQAPYFAKGLWVRLEEPDVLPEAELKQRIQQSYALVVAQLPKKVQATLLHPE